MKLEKYKPYLLALAFAGALAQPVYAFDHATSEASPSRHRVSDDADSSSRGRDAAELWCASDGPNGDSAYDLKKFKGKETFYEMMKDEDNGMKAAIDNNFTTKFKIVDAAGFEKFENAFAPKVLHKFTSLFADGDKSIHKLLGKLAVEGEDQGQFTPSSLRVALRKVFNDNPDILTDEAAEKVALTAAKVAPVLGIASGSGLLVRIDDKDCYINYGYARGDREGDEKSGRSFDVTSNEPALDPSDIDYLKSLNDLLDPQKDNSDFYRAMFQLLTKTDPTGFAKLDPQARTVLTRWAAIYSAEHDRWLMSDEKAHDWQNALTEATLLSPYVMASGKVFFNNELQDGDPTNFFGVGSVGSGLGGKLGIQRRKFQSLVTDALRETKSGKKALQEVEAITGKQKDIFRGIMSYLNNSDTDQDEVRKNSADLTDAVVDLEQALSDNADHITKYLKDQE